MVRLIPSCLLAELLCDWTVPAHPTLSVRWLVKDEPLSTNLSQHVRCLSNSILTSFLSMVQHRHHRSCCCCSSCLQELCQKIMAGTFNTPDWLSPGARDLLGRMLTVDPEARITIAEAAQHPWTRSSGILWELPSTHCYSLPSSTQGGTTAADRSSIRSSNSSSDSARPLSGGGIPSASGNGDGVEAQSSILEELEGHGYSRPAVVRYLAASECNYITASYYLLAEAKAEAAQKLLPAKPWPFQPVAISSRGSSSSRSRAASSGNATTAAAGAAAAARPASGAGRPPIGVATGYSRPATAVAVSS